MSRETDQEDEYWNHADCRGWNAHTHGGKEEEELKIARRFWYDGPIHYLGGKTTVLTAKAGLPENKGHECLLDSDRYTNMMRQSPGNLLVVRLLRWFARQTCHHFCVEREVHVPWKCLSLFVGKGTNTRAKELARQHHTSSLLEIGTKAILE